MTTYRLGVDGWVPHVTDPGKWTKYFAAQVAGRPPPKTSPYTKTKDVANGHTPVKVQLVSGVQDAVDRANAVLRHIKEDERGDQDSQPSTVNGSTTSHKSISHKRPKKKKKITGVKKLNTASKTKKKKISKHRPTSHQLATDGVQKARSKRRKALSRSVKAVQPQDVWGTARWG